MQEPCRLHRPHLHHRKDSSVVLQCVLNQRLACLASPTTDSVLAVPYD